jgi:hypothetical protein
MELEEQGHLLPEVITFTPPSVAHDETSSTISFEGWTMLVFVLVYESTSSHHSLRLQFDQYLARFILSRALLACYSYATGYPVQSISVPTACDLNYAVYGVSCYGPDGCNYIRVCLMST